MRKPRIAIPEIDQNVNNYVRAVTAAGMEPIVISVQTEQIQQNYQQEYLDYSEFRIENYDGLLIPGGWDINPARYGQKINGSIGIMDSLDELQFSMLDEFVKSRKPVLGICRGHQIINVYFGGTLIQHLPASFRHSRNPDEDDRVHICEAGEESWLSQIYGTKFFHNSVHHQAVDHLGRGLVADSYCPDDGTVEALHHSVLPIYGVQWHPERMCLGLERSDTVNGFLIMQFFCSICGGEPEDYDVYNKPEVMSEMMGL